MSKAQFQLAFDGPGLRAGAMDVNQLAPALLATGDLLREVNRQINGEKADVSVKVLSDFKRGSFEVALIVDQTLIEHAKNLLWPITTEKAAVLITLVFGKEVLKSGTVGAINSVLDLWKKARGEKPKSTIEDKEKNTTIVVLGDNNQINCHSAIAKLYEEPSIREAIANTVRPVEDPRISSLEVRRGEKVINAVRKQDLPQPTQGMEQKSITHQVNVLESTREAMLRVTRANFEKGKWGFSDNQAQFNADIEDKMFIERLDAREVGFYKGDVVRVLLKTVQHMTPEQAFRTTYTIVRVIDHLHAPKQQDLIEATETPKLPPAS